MADDVLIKLNVQVATVVKQVARLSLCLWIALGLVGCQTTTHQTTRPAGNKRVPAKTNSINAVNPRIYNKAYQQFLERAQEGDSIAALNLGQMYADGRGVEANDRQAFHWFQQAAHKGLPDAKVSLGVAYLFAMGTTKNTRQACKLFRQAMKQGEPNAKAFYREYCKY